MKFKNYDWQRFPFSNFFHLVLINIASKSDIPHDFWFSDDFGDYYCAFKKLQPEYQNLFPCVAELHIYEPGPVCEKISEALTSGIRIWETPDPLNRFRLDLGLGWLEFLCAFKDYLKDENPELPTAFEAFCKEITPLVTNVKKKRC